MIQFEISAPGAITLFGDYAMVYEKTGLATSLDLRTTLKFTELPQSRDSSDVITIEVSHLHLSLNLPLQTFQNYFFGASPFNGNADLLHKMVPKFIMTQDSLRVHRKKAWLKALFYLLVYITYKEQIDMKPFQICLSSPFPINEEGPSNSETFTVCLAACYLHWSRLQKRVQKQLDHNDLKTIEKYAWTYEKNMGSFLATIHIMLSTYGSMVEFKQGEVVEMLFNAPDLMILLVDLKEAPDVATQMQHVMQMKRSYPAVVDFFFNSIDAISNTAIKILYESSQIYANFQHDIQQRDTRYLKEMQKLGPLIYMNQTLLNMLKMTHVKLVTVCSMAQIYGLWGKYTGAGRYAYIWWQSNTMNAIALYRDLKNMGFDVTMTTAPCSGVRIESN